MSDAVDELDDKFDENLHLSNKAFKPYRNPIIDEEGNDNDTDSDDDDQYSIAASTIMDPKLVRARVQKSLLQRMKKEKRRIRNKGESALTTAKMRDINDDIKSCLKLD